MSAPIPQPTHQAPSFLSRLSLSEPQRMLREIQERGVYSFFINSGESKDGDERQAKNHHRKAQEKQRILDNTLYSEAIRNNLAHQAAKIGHLY